MVSVAKRRKLPKDNGQETTKRKREEQEEERKVWKATASAMPVERWRLLPTVVAEKATQFTVHDSHSAIVCGGYCGCLVCGSVAGFHGNARLKEVCRGYCPLGSSGPVKRLARGSLPHVQRDCNGMAWPSGEACPVVEKLCRSIGVVILGDVFRQYARKA